MKREYLIKSIFETIKDYKMPSESYMSCDHIERWVYQFEKDDQDIILQEMDGILKRFYLSREAVKERIKSVLTSNVIFGDNPINRIRNTTFLSIQTRGSSQKDLLEIVDEVLEEEYNLSIESCSSEDFYFYIDDCIFTGNKFVYDLLTWINKNKFNQGSKLFSYHIALHKSGWSYAYKRIKSEADTKGLEIEGWRHMCINDIKEDNSSIEVLWPLKCEDCFVEDYHNKVIEICKTNRWNDKLFRNPSTTINEVLFTSDKARNIVEKAFLKVGAKLVMSAESPAQSMRPLGFQKLESLGFGSFFITYRNIANNCPLALWYGNPTYEGNHPFRMWYPLFPRMTQGNGVSINIKPKEIDLEELFNER
ncbi:phosphoribosyltransferase-like protein [Clostridium algidicarnis]|uniref:phosphoribosyltransferase-like protein n=1 Tax=Clostridium algidicarnis TaxID=37659 RepID=UPI000496ADC0|nr:hypothetical protein [Clostridium algidicarnis]